MVQQIINAVHVYGYSVASFQALAFTPAQKFPYTRFLDALFTYALALKYLYFLLFLTVVFKTEPFLSVLTREYLPFFFLPA